jgi:hypothetical protein
MIVRTGRRKCYSGRLIRWTPRRHELAAFSLLPRLDLYVDYKHTILCEYVEDEAPLNRDEGR